MPKYNVRIYEIHYLDIPVEATNEREATEKAEVIINQEDVSAYEQGYSHTVEKDEWKVSEI